MHNHLQLLFTSFTLTRHILVKHYFIPFFFTAAVLRLSTVSDLLIPETPVVPMVLVLMDPLAVP